MSSARIIRWIAATALGLSPAGAQLSGLTAREAGQLVEMLPEVQASMLRGECPSLGFDAHSGGPGNFWIQARGACWHPGGPASLLIDNYKVDRKKGIVGKGIPPAIAEKSRALLAQAKAKVLSSSEAMCLASEAAKSQFGVGNGDGSLSLKDLGLHGDEWRMYSAVLALPGGKAIAARDDDVSVETGEVVDAGTGREILSDGLANLRARMLGLREPPMLSITDVLEIAQRVPWIAERLQDPCTSISAFADFGLADESYVELYRRCPGAADEEEKIAVSVNILTGALVDPETRAQLASPGSQQIAEKVFARLAKAKRDDRATVESQCRIVTAPH